MTRCTATACLKVLLTIHITTVTGNLIRDTGKVVSTGTEPSMTARGLKTLWKATVPSLGKKAILVTLATGMRVKGMVKVSSQILSLEGYLSDKDGNSKEGIWNNDELERLEEEEKCEN